MPIFLHNTLTRTREEFRPIDPQHVRMYVCGPTVYDYAHLGNAVPVVFFDVLYRLLKHSYPHVTYARNFTDIDDKIMNRAAEEKIAIEVLTARFEQQYLDDMGALGTLVPDIMPRATEHMAEMIAMIGKLIAGGHAYEAEGQVLFHVPSMPNYGRLSRHSRDDLIAGARVDVASYKKDSADFTLWKPSTPDQVGWDSPWGRGRPGWHIECSAMTEKHLGETFDIHAGGNDLIFPHHENEIAQSECAHGGRIMANTWLHNGHLLVNGRKMSKSEGNFTTVAEQLAKHPGEGIRFTLLKSHYRSPIDFSAESFSAAQEELNGLYRRLETAPAGGTVDPRIVEALSNDLNTPLAISLLHEISDADLRPSAALLGLLQQEPAQWFQWLPQGTADGEYIEQLIAERAAVRAAKNFARSDEIRDELAKLGITLEDKHGTTTWRRS